MTKQCLLHFLIFAQRKLSGRTFYHSLILSEQKFFRRHFLQGTPCHTASNWSAAASTSAGTSVRMPASKLRVIAPFMPSPALVRLATYVSDLAIEDQYFEMYARTQPPLQSAPQQRIFVEIVGEVPSRLFGMNQPHLDTAADQFLQHFQQRCGTVALFHIKIFNIGRADPEVLFYSANTFNHFCIVCFVLNVAEHNGIFCKGRRSRCLAGNLL